MNLQHVNADVLLAAKNRIKELQEFFATKERDIQNVLDTYDKKKELAGHRSMTRDEFNLLYPNPPFIEEDAQITDKRAKHGALQAEFAAHPDKRSSLSGSLKSLQLELRELEASKTVKLNGYYATQANPHRSLTDEEFLVLYPAPKDADFAAEKSAISAAQTEADSIHSFLKSGPYPNPGNYDVDLLSGTAITYP